MPQITVFTTKETDSIILKFQDKWKKEGMQSTNKNDVINRIIEEYNKIIE